MRIEINEPVFFGIFENMNEPAFFGTEGVLDQ
jgi:hypothetical protein